MEETKKIVVESVQESPAASFFDQWFLQKYELSG